MKTAHFKGKFIISLLTLYIILIQCLTALAQPDLTSHLEIQVNKSIEDGTLNFPRLTLKVYQLRKYQPLWFDGALPKKQLWEASELINAAPNYGLNKTDYHNDQLASDYIKGFTQSSVAGTGYKALLDILATDAMLTLVTHLHYGRVNPGCSIEQIDEALVGDLKPDSALIAALSVTDFSGMILNVQPNLSGYRNLQAYLESSTKQLNNESLPSAETIRIISLNLERWRWVGSVSAPYIHINIPAFQLEYINGDTIEEFKVIIGKPNTPTPVLRSRVGYFTTSPDWTVPKNIAVKELLPKAIANPSYLENNNFRVYDKKGNTIAATVENLKMVRSHYSSYVIKQSPGCDNALGQIVFNFENKYSVYLHDTPDRTLFERSDRALSHGCIRVNNPEKLVALFLEQDSAGERIEGVHQAMRSYKRTRTTLKRPVPIIISYLTCAVHEGTLVVYKDLYNNDPSLEKSLRMSKLSKQ